MARAEQHTLSETARSELAALDAALAGEPVSAQHADLADIALLLREERRRPGPELVARLDELTARRVAERRGVWRELPRARRAPARRRRVPLGRSAMIAAIAAVLVALAIPAAFALLGGRAQQRSPQQGAAGDLGGRAARRHQRRRRDDARTAQRESRIGACTHGPAARRLSARGGSAPRRSNWASRLIALLRSTSRSSRSSTPSTATSSSPAPPSAPNSTAARAFSCACPAQASRTRSRPSLSSAACCQRQTRPTT